MADWIELVQANAVCLRAVTDMREAGLAPMRLDGLRGGVTRRLRQRPAAAERVFDGPLPSTRAFERRRPASAWLSREDMDEAVAWRGSKPRCARPERRGPSEARRRPPVNGLQAEVMADITGEALMPELRRATSGTGYGDA